MATEIVMPKLGLTMESGAISAWLVEEGQEVQRGQALLEIATDKVTMEVEAQADGILRKILVPVGQEVPVSTTIGVIAAADEDIDSYVAAPSEPASSPPPAPAAAPSDPAPPATPAPVAPAPSPAPSVATDGRRPHKTSPKARKIADEHGLDLSGVNGSGPGGRIVSADVLALVEQGRLAPAPTPVAPVAEGLVELSRAEQVAAERLTASYQQIPHIHISMDVSAVWLQQFRTGYQLEGKKISFNDLIVKATARTLSEFPSRQQLGRGRSFPLCLPNQRRRCRSGRAGIGGSGHSRRSRKDGRGNRFRRDAADRCSSPRRAGSRRHAGRNLYHLEFGHVRRLPLYRDHQPSPSGNPSCRGYRKQGSRFWGRRICRAPAANPDFGCGPPRRRWRASRPIPRAAQGGSGNARLARLAAPHLDRI